MMKRLIVPLIALVILLGGFSWYRSSDAMPATNQIEEVASDEIVDLVVDFGDEKASYSATLVEGDTVLSVLKRVSVDKHTLLIKEYDFGSLVIGIDGNENTKEKSWIYFVNGNSGEVGADQKILEDGNMVEWKYIEPIY